MNVTFNLATKELEQKFLQEAAAQGFVGLAGSPLHWRLPGFHLQRGTSRCL